MRPSFVAIAVLVLSGIGRAQSFPPIPQGTAVYDGADLLSPQDENAISGLSQAFMRDTGAPIVVATFPSLAQVGAQGMGIERYSTALFDNWRIGRNDASGGILLVVARDDHKVRIELGKDWQHDYDAAARQVNQNVILPAFRRGDFAGGIRSGVEALAHMADGSNANAQEDEGQSGGIVDTPLGPPSGTPMGGGLAIGSLVCPGLVLLGIIVAISRAANRRRYYGNGYNAYGPNGPNGPVIYDDPANDAAGFAAGMIAGQMMSQPMIDPYDSGMVDPGPMIDNGSSDIGGFDSGGFDSSSGFDSGSSGGGGDTGSW